MHGVGDNIFGSEVEEEIFILGIKMELEFFCKQIFNVMIISSRPKSGGIIRQGLSLT